MNKISHQNIFIGLLLIGVLIGNYFLNKDMKSTGLVEYSKCRLGIDACEIIINNKHLSVVLDGEVKALAPFFIKISDKNNLIDNAIVSFKMKAMDMGVNKYRFIKGNSNWSAKIIIPICTTGRRDWLAEIEVQYANTIRKVTFNIEI